MEREEIEQIKVEIRENIDNIEKIQKQFDYGSRTYVQLEIAKSNYYIALTNLI